jgi:single-stranded-DNA-specific exonuclease
MPEAFGSDAKKVRQRSAKVEPWATHPVWRRIYASRGITKEDVDYKLQNLRPAQNHHQGLLQAAERVFVALQKQEQMVILGDYDADGATSTALGISVLRQMGAKAIDFVIPDRFKHGYGLSAAIVDVIWQKHKPKLLITVDNGIANHQGVLRAKSYGMEVLITDHHLPADTLPAADYIINPNVPGDALPSSNLAGVGVLFYLLIAIRQLARQQGHPAGQVHLGEALDLVALGSIADVVPLDVNNRILVSNGIDNIRKKRCRPGIQALAAQTGVALEQLKSSDFGFRLGPRINAAGRLENMEIGIHCLLANTLEEANAWAKELDGLNHQRQDLQEQMRQKAEVLVENIIQKQGLPSGICLFDAEWHEGIIGLIASKIKDRYHRPTIIFAPAQEADLLKGSARSLDGFHIRDALAEIDRCYPGLITKFGGHAAAAGLSIQQDKLSIFQKAFDEITEKNLTEEQLSPLLLTDGELSAEDLTIEFVQSLDNHPWGQGCPPPLFEGTFFVEDQRLLKDKHLKLKVRHPDGELFDALRFQLPALLPPRTQQVRLVYRPEYNLYRGRSNISLFIDYIEII